MSFQDLNQAKMTSVRPLGMIFSFSEERTDVHQSVCVGVCVVKARRCRKCGRGVGTCKGSNPSSISVVSGGGVPKEKN